jgi:hypothetical protein
MVLMMAVAAPLAAVPGGPGPAARPCAAVVSPSPSPSAPSAPAGLHARVSVREHRAGAGEILDYRIELRSTVRLPAVTVVARLRCAPSARFAGRPRTTSGQAETTPGTVTWRLAAGVRSATADYTVRVPDGTADRVVTELSVAGSASNCPADPQCRATVAIRPKGRPASPAPPPSPVPASALPASPGLPSLPAPSPSPSAPSLTLSLVDRPPLVPAVSPPPSAAPAAPSATTRPAAYSRGSVSTSTLALVAGVLTLMLAVVALVGRLAGLDVVRRRSGRS